MTMTRYLKRMGAMTGAELRWRAGAASRIAVDRAAAALRRPRWYRSSVCSVIGDAPNLVAIRSMCARKEWLAAHRSIAKDLRASTSFLLVPDLRDSLVARITREFPASAADAARRADAMVAGEFDLLGYTHVRFDGAAPGVPDWHLDPLASRRAPARFWSTVPFLDPAECGDHKVIWELNRHQYLLALGRAFWLTGDARYRDTAVAHLRGWIAANPPLVGINWASMLELGFRALSWLWMLHFFAEAAESDAEPWTIDLLVALDRQLAHVQRNLSYYFSPNTHLLGEALALYVTGQTLRLLRRADCYAETGRRILVTEIQRQIARDGGHVERSTHYQRYTLDFYLTALGVARVTGDPVADQFEEAVRRLGSAARLLADDSGRLPHIGDDDGGVLQPICGRPTDDASDSLAIASALTDRPELRIGPFPEEAYWLLSHPRLRPLLEHAKATARLDTVGSAALADTGYYVSRSPSGHHLVVDAGPHGFANAGHAHADALSLTLSVGAIPLLIDPGTGLYTADPAVRDRFRSTDLHNTLTVDGRWQSQAAGPFHWSRSAHATAHVWRSNAGFDYLEASHDGYTPLEHRRHIMALHGDLVIVADFIGGEGDHAVAVHWHLDPRWKVQAAGRAAALHSEAGRVDIAVSRGTLTPVTASAEGIGWHSPVYGRIEPTWMLRVTADGPLPSWIVSVFGLDEANPVLAVDPVPVWARAGALERGTAVRIARSHSVDFFGIGSPSSVPSGTPANAAWRVAAYETDARALFCRITDLAWRVAMVDGSFVRTAERRPMHLSVPDRASDLHLDLALTDRGRVDARISGPAFGAELTTGGRPVDVAVERRATVRPSAGRTGVAR
jgi:hypothetical protein